MHRYSLTHLADRTLLHDLAALVAQDRGTTAKLLAHLAEVDERKLYLPAAYSSLYAYCVVELRMSEQSAFRRIQAARTARRFPAIFDCIADGRLHLSAVVMLSPHLTDTTAEALLSAAAHKTKSELEQLIARHFPQPDLPTRIEAVPPPRVSNAAAPSPVEDPVIQLAPGRVQPDMPKIVGLTVAPPVDQRRLEQPSASAPAPVQPPAPRATVAPLSPERFALQLTISKHAHDRLRQAQELLGHRLASGDIAAVIELALDELVHKLEKTRFAATAKPRPARRAARDARHVPAHVKRTVWKRDGGQCTFVGNSGKRCTERARLEFDHVEPVARGGSASVAGIRLRCQAHNQYAAECAYGVAFMRGKREEAQRKAADRRRTQTFVNDSGQQNARRRAAAPRDTHAFVDDDGRLNALRLPAS